MIRQSKYDHAVGIAAILKREAKLIERLKAAPPIAERKADDVNAVSR